MSESTASFAPTNASRPVLVASGKGGVGVSVTAALVALSVSERGERVLLVDATEGAGSVHGLFGVRPTTSLWQLHSSRVRVDDVVVQVDEHLSIVPGGTSAGAEPPTDDGRRRSALAKVARLFADYDLVVVDGGSRLDGLAAVSELVDMRLLMVTSADRFALAANYAVVKSIGARFADADRFVIANRHAEGLAITSCQFLTDACKNFLSRPVSFVGSLPDDACLQAGVGAGMSVQDALDGSPAASAMRGLVSRIAPPPLFVDAQAARPFAPPFPRRWS